MIACLFAVFHTLSFFVGVQTVAGNDPDLEQDLQAQQREVRQMQKGLTYEWTFQAFDANDRRIGKCVGNYRKFLVTQGVKDGEAE